MTVPVLATLLVALFLATPASTLNPCSHTPYPHLCVDAVFDDAISSTLRHTLLRVSKTREDFRRIVANVDNMGSRKMRALDDCLQLMEQSIFQLNTSIATTDIRDLQAQLSASATTQRTCIHVLQQAGLTRHVLINSGLLYINRQISNALAMAAAQQPSSSDSKYGLAYPMTEDGYPEWMSEDDQKLLSADEKDSYDCVVAQDGSGKFTTINDAVNAAPSGSQKRFVIYIKAGTYNENVDVKQEKTNIMFLGDGIGKTVIRGDHSQQGGFSILSSYVLNVVGNGFIAKGITIENYAGPGGGPAVALESSSDYSAFYQCSILGYQDTLFAVSFRQFYRECDIYGTVDFIFGNPSAVFQKCNIYLRKPATGQGDVITAQSRGSPTETTAISFIECQITAAPDLYPDRHSIRSFLGRPWRECARVVYMKSYIGDVIDPTGWAEMSADASTFKDLYFGEYMNNGPGADTRLRVKWPGMKIITNPNDAAQFTAGALINADQWLKASGIPYYSGLPQ